MKKNNIISKRIIATIVLIGMFSMYLPTVNYAVMTLNETEKNETANIVEEEEEGNLQAEHSENEINKEVNADIKNDNVLNDENKKESADSTGATSAEKATETINNNNQIISGQFITNEDKTLQKVGDPINENNDDEIIEFKDDNFKQYLLRTINDSNSDGNISKKEMETLNYLNLASYNGFRSTSIDEIQYAINLEDLSITNYDSSNRINLKCLAKLKNLKSLHLSGHGFSGIEDSEIFEGLENLERLYFGMSQQTLDISKLENCKELRELVVETMGGKLKNVEGFSNLINLESLSIAQYDDFDVSKIANLLNKDKMKRLICRGSAKNIDGIWRLENLETLEINGENGGKTTDFTGITSLKKLKELYVTGFEFLTAVEGLEKVTELNSLERLNLDFGFASSHNVDLKEQRLINIIENVKCESFVLSGDYLVNLKGIKCGSKLEVDFKDLGPIMKASMNPESRLYNETRTVTKGTASYNGKEDIEIDNENKKIIITARDQLESKEAKIDVGGYNGFNGGIRLTWNNINLEDNPAEVNIPDTNLKKALLDNYDLDGDEIITTNDLNNIIDLNLVKQNIKDLTGLEKAVNLVSLNLSNNEITNLEPLANLEKIESLTLMYNKISDIRPIKATLKKDNIWCNLSNNYITDLTGLEEINFDEIDLGFNYFDVSKGSNNYKIIENQSRNAIKKEHEEHPEWFGDDFDLDEITNNRVERITGWYGYSKCGTPEERDDILEFDEAVKQKLIEVGYDINSDGNLTKGELSDFDMVRTLDLSNMEITNIDNLKYLNKIIELDLSNNNITDITPLKYCKRMRRINLNNNKISDITPIKDLFNAFEIKLANNQIKDINPLGNIRTAEPVYGYDGYFAGDAGIERGLIIDLSNNQISNISTINKLTTLSSINLSGNRITDISVLANYDFNKLFGDISEEEMQWFEEQPVTIDVSNNMIKVDSEGTKKAVKHFEDNKSTIKLDNQTAPQYGLGDVNGDGKINVIDCTAILKHIKGTKLLSEDEQSRADINGDGKINVIDCTSILKHIKGTKLIE